MKLEKPIIELGPCPDNLFQYLKNYILSLDWDNTDTLTKEEAFFDQSYRYEASTNYFNKESYFYSNIPPNTEITEKLRPYTEYLTNLYFPDHEIFRCQIVCLKPGQNVYPHIDPRYYHAHGHRVHLPITINDNSYHVHFIPENNYDMILSKMSTGIIVDFDNITPHSAFNYGNTNRIHIITDIVKNSVVEKLKNALNGNSNATNKKTIDEYYLHLKSIEEKYECNHKDLKIHYLRKIESIK